MLAFLITITYFFLICFFIYKHPFFHIKQFNKLLLPSIFTIKIFVAVFFYLIYTYYYTDRQTADIFKFYDDSLLLYDVFKESPKDFFRLIVNQENTPLQQAYVAQMNFWNNSNPNEWYNDSRLMIRVNALLQFISFGYYGVHLVVFTFLSFVGFTLIFRALEPFFYSKKQLLVVVFFIPSVMFWSSGVSKESLLFLGLGLFLYAFFKPSNIKKWLLLLLAMVVLLLIKPYILLLILPAFVIYSLIEKYQIKTPIIIYLTTYVGLFLMTVLAGYFFPQYSVVSQIVTKQNNFINMAQGGVYMNNNEGEVRVPYEKIENVIFINDTLCRIKLNTSYEFRQKGTTNFIPVAQNTNDTTIYEVHFNQAPSGSLIHTQKIENHWMDLLLSLPKAWYHAMFKPFLLSSKNPLLLLSGIENCCVFLLMIVAVIFRKQQLKLNLIVLFLIASTILMMFVGLTTPVMGAIVRYKTPAVLFLMLALLLIMDFQHPFWKKLLKRNSH